MGVEKLIMRRYFSARRRRVCIVWSSSLIKESALLYLDYGIVGISALVVVRLGVRIGRSSGVAGGASRIDGRDGGDGYWDWRGEGRADVEGGR